MIARHWSGLAKQEHAAEYVAHLRTQTFPSLTKIPGFIAARILKRSVSEGVEFLIVTEWDSLQAIQRFAGSDAEQAVVPEAVQQMMVRYDRTVRHYEVIDP
jgi:heme-degrading monooxygenase HmoA